MTSSSDSRINPSSARPALSEHTATLPARSRVLVTGASGFIGGRLAECLVSQGVDVTCIVRNRRRAARLAHLPVRTVKVDLGDADRLSPLVSQANYVFHCAYDVQEPRRNLVFLRNLLSACTLGTLRRFVHVSSFSVYQPFPEGLLSEQAADGDRSNDYVHIKLELEKTIFDAVGSQGLPATVLQPAIVYGPHGGVWTQLVANRLRTGDVVLPDSGSGCCNAVYVDDVVDSLCLAAISPHAIGERFIISGPQPVTWAQFYRKLAQEISAEPPVFSPAADILEEASTRASADRWPHLMLKRIWRSRRVQRLLGENLRHALARSAGLAGRERHLPDKGILQLYQSTAIASCRKAEHAIDYRPRVSFEEGMQLTGKYLRQRLND
jgi:nucleoside-diphosphate-sugar epimerase